MSPATLLGNELVADMSASSFLYITYSGENTFGDA
jgi:hypothetical protein